jgi:isocitrate dehydrogenase kinase/phosphatase
LANPSETPSPAQVATESGQTVLLIERAFARLAACSDYVDRITATAKLILAVFDEFYRELCECPYWAQCAFEIMDPHLSIRISRERLGLYSRYISEYAPLIGEAFPELAEDSGAWDSMDPLFCAMIVNRYEADIAFSFAHSLRRLIVRDLWKPVAYSFPRPSKFRAMSLASVHRRLPVHGRVDVELLCTALQVPDFTVRFRDLRGDAARVLERLERQLCRTDGAAWPVALDVVEAGFFRDRYALVVGRWVMGDGSYLPLVVALLNSSDGIYVDAVLHEVANIHDLFSSALANFHVTTRLYYQTCVFLYSIMPRRPLGHHYSTIGFNHVAKVVILDEIVEQMRRSGQKFRRSPGALGTVALGFTFDACDYHLKVIRDRPTRSYKWNVYPGVAAILDKYRNVHELNRAGSMLDNVMYFHLRLERDMFDPDLLEQICREAAGSVQLDQDAVVLRSLIVQRKIVPLPVYIGSASEAEIRAVIASLGQCIRNNAATNIFNKDLDSRNYGVGQYGRVLLFDYDAVEKLTDVKIRSNTDREPGEEDIPGWFFEDGIVFLPEEIEYGMQLSNDYARRCFRRENADLLTVRYWQDVQRQLQSGQVPELSMYPDRCRLHGGADGA